MVATLVEHASTILYALAALKHFSDFFMSLDLLELLVWVEVRILVVEAYNHT